MLAVEEWYLHLGLGHKQAEPRRQVELGKQIVANMEVEGGIWVAQCLDVVIWYLEVVLDMRLAVEKHRELVGRVQHPAQVETEVVQDSHERFAEAVAGHMQACQGLRWVDLYQQSGVVH